MTTQNTTDNEPGEALKPCPFCGSHAHVKTTTEFGSLPIYWIECVICEIGTKFHESPRLAAETWNSRAPLAAVGEDALCKCGHPKSRHEFYSDHDECTGCVAREDADNDGLCCEFRRAAAASSAPAEPPPHPFIVLSQDLFDALTIASHELKAAVEIGAANPIYAQALTIIDTMLKRDAHRPAEPPLQPEGEQERLTGVMVGSSRHPHFTHADHERMKATLDALSDNPTEEEAEAVRRATTN